MARGLLNVSIDLELAARVRETTQRLGVSQSRLVEVALRKLLEGDDLPDLKGEGKEKEGRHAGGHLRR